MLESINCTQQEGFVFMWNPRRFILSLTILAATTIVNAFGVEQKGADALAPSIIPQPRQITAVPGSFTLNRHTVLVYAEGERGLLPCVTALARTLRQSTGYPLRIVDLPHRPAENAIVLSLTPEDTIGTEGYGLTVQPHEIIVHAPAPNGVFYGVNTLLQLFPPAILSERIIKGGVWTAPCVNIVDAPRYPWRGMMLDVSRHFFPKEFVKRFIDYLALHKMNTFHWHLTDDQGWRIQINRYPELTSIGAWRVDHENVHWNVRPEQQPGERATYGGFYTQEEIREVVRYATDRFITIVPEIEMPAHVSAVISAYPQYSCTGGPFTVPAGGIWPIKDIYCAGNDSTFIFVENVLKEVAALFPGTYIHIGGDEADKEKWRSCPKCQARIRSEHLKDEAELQSYFTKRVETILTGLNKRLLGWDEIIEGGLAPRASVMSWRGVNGGIAAARSGHDVVMSPTSNCYLDYYQADRRWEPLAIGGFLPLAAVYAYEPTPDSLTQEEAHHILGTQGNLWTEYIPDRAHLEYMAFPRLAAIAENGWSARDRRSWPDFVTRLDRQFQRYSAHNINASRSVFAVAIRESIDVAAHTAIVTLSTQSGSGNIHYTLDGKRPTTASPAYAGPFTVKKSTTIIAAAFANARQLAPAVTKRVWVPRYEIASISCETPFDSPDAASAISSLFNNRRGEPANSDKMEWRGLGGKTMAVTVDLGKASEISRVTIGFLHQMSASTFLPPRVELALSLDGKNFTPAGHASGETLQKETRPFVKDYSLALKNVQARYLRLTASNAGPLPAWHKNAGKPSFLLADEIIVE